LPMKQILNRRQRVLFYLTFGMMVFGLLGIYGCAWLDHRFPEPYHDMNFFGYFDTPGILFVALFLFGLICSAVWTLWFLAITILFFLHRIKKTPKANGRTTASTT